MSSTRVSKAGSSVAEMTPAMKIVITSGYIPAELRVHAEAAGITLFEKVVSPNWREDALRWQATR